MQHRVSMYTKVYITVSLAEGGSRYLIEGIKAM